MKPGNTGLMREEVCIFFFIYLGKSCLPFRKDETVLEIKSKVVANLSTSATHHLTTWFVHRDLPKVINQ